MDTYYFVINPASRSGKGLQIWEKAEAILVRKQIKYEALLLRGPGDAANAARYLYEECTPCTVVIVGGDGTVNEFVDALPSFEGITLGYLPTGSGNDFARSMQLPSKPEDAIEAILHPKKVRNINIGIAASGEESRCFAISSGVGFDAAICYASNASTLKTLLNRIHAGKLIYLINALRMLIAQKPRQARILLDDRELLTFRKMYFVTAMNMRYEGGGFMLCPKASPVDNLLDLIVVDDIPKWKVLLVLPTALLGRHTDYKGVHIYRCRRAVIQCAVEECVHTDGESFGFYKKLTMSLKKEKLRLIID